MVDTNYNKYTFTNDTEITTYCYRFVKTMNECFDNCANKMAERVNKFDVELNKCNSRKETSRVIVAASIASVVTPAQIHVSVYLCVYVPLEYIILIHQYYNNGSTDSQLLPCFFGLSDVKAQMVPKLHKAPYPPGLCCSPVGSSRCWTLQLSLPPSSAGEDHDRRRYS